MLLRTYMYILLVDRIKQKFIHKLIRKNECYVYDGAIDASKKQIRVRAADGSECVEPYDKLLLSPGASPVVPPL